MTSVSPGTSDPSIRRPVSIANRPKTTKKSADDDADDQHLDRLADEQDQADVDPLRARQRRSVAPPRRSSGASRAARAPAGRRDPRSDEEADRADVGERRSASRTSATSPGREREQGEDREQRDRVREQAERRAQLAGEPAEHPAQDRQQAVDEDRVDQRQQERGWRRSSSPRCRVGRRRSAAAAPAGSRTRRARSCRGGCGIARAGRPRRTLMIAIAASMRASAPAIASRFCHQLQSSLPAPSSSPTKTRPSSGAARLKTSVEAEKPSTNSGSPARRKRRSYSASCSACPRARHSARFPRPCRAGRDGGHR